ncbi:MAG TPA: hypothetical protein VLR71_10300 [Casimicrobiaceae bacterium]|nr:hypothetical protein [Casimicrobiaceae bacterium]
MKGVLNLFQANMLRWRELHPYNAVHAVALDPPMQLESLQAAVRAELEHWGLTGLVVDRAHGRYEYGGGPAHSVLARVQGSRRLETLEAEIERQLNAPFPDTASLDPFRFFLVDADDGAMLGLSYDHFVAGGDCIIALLHAIVARAHGAPSAATLPVLYPPTQGWLFARNVAHVVGGLARLPALIRSARTTVRPRYRNPADGTNGYRLHVLPPPFYARLLSCSKAWGVTLNDALLALLLDAVAPFAPKRMSASRRRALAVASIMNLRGEYGDAGAAAFGQFLGSLRVSHPVPEGMSFEALARDVHAETSRIKREKLYLQTLLAMRYVAAVWRALSPDQRAGFYAKTYPIWAGLSALNVNALWPRPNEAAAPPVYIRGVPTGPVAPVVLAVTTVGDTLYAGLSFRTAAFTRADIDNLWSGVRRRLDTLS